MIGVVLQPSYIPWRGYFDLIFRADVFVFYDDVQFDKHGWRNRNRVKTSAGTQWLTIPVKKKGNVEDAIPIMDVAIDANAPWAKKHLATLKQSYARAPFLKPTIDLIEPFYERASRSRAGEKPYDKLCDFTIDTTIAIAENLGISRSKFVRSSSFGDLPGQKSERLVSLLKTVGVTHYISGPSAKDYIEDDAFARAGIGLEYIVYDYPEYEQLHPPFDAFVTILDLMFMKGPSAPDFIWRAKA